MYESLYEHTSDFHLYIFAFDDLSRELLLKLKLDKVTVISLDEFEDDELRRVKKERSVAEYCWTCTPSVISYVLKKFGVNDCTYIDSDLYFSSDPTILIGELNQFRKNVLVTEHRFSFLPRIYELKRAGRFCVQFLTFRNEESSLKILDRWRLQCIDWCYSRYEDGKFGDQKYLDEWPRLYANIHILQHKGGGVAPWNFTQYRFFNNGNKIKGIEKKSGIEFDLVFSHFQYVRFLKNGSVDIGWHRIARAIKKMFYIPYLAKIRNVESKLSLLDNKYQTGYSEFKSGGLKGIIKMFLKKILKYNIMNFN